MLKLSNITVGYGGVKALDNLSFELNKSGVDALIGPNGAGKTTLFNVITGFVRQFSGEIVFGKKNISGKKPEEIFMSGVSRTFQNLNLVSSFTLRENIILGVLGKNKNKFITKEDNEKFDHYLELTGVIDYSNRQVSELSYGILKFFEISRALISQPKLLLLDEPAAGLNNSEKDNMAELIQKIDSSELKIFLVEHDLDFLAAVAKEVICLEFGRKIFQGTINEMQNDKAVIAAYLGE